MVRAIRNNSDSAAGARTEFTPVSATKMLPLVRRIADDMLRLTQSISAQREQIREIDQLPQTIGRVDYQDEVSDIRGSLALDEKRLDDCRRELVSLGLETHMPFDGAVDFPSILNRRKVQLCWVLGEDRVEYWHEVGQTRDDRKKIASQEFGIGSHN